jgi:hypothetical protein
MLSRGARVPDGIYELVYSRHERVLNFVKEDIVVSLCKAGIPGSIYRISGFPDTLSGIRTIEITSARLVVNGDSCYLMRSTAVQPITPVPADLSLLHSRLCHCERILEAQAAETSIPNLLKTPEQKLTTFDVALKDSFAQGLELFAAADIEKAAAKFRGLGYGLTPSGDDFLRGMLLALSWLMQEQKNRLSELHRQLYCASRAKDLLINTLLYQARDLQPSDDWMALLCALPDPQQDLSSIIRLIFAQGASSPADELFGFLSGLKLFGF